MKKKKASNKLLTKLLDQETNKKQFKHQIFKINMQISVSFCAGELGFAIILNSFGPL